MKYILAEAVLTISDGKYTKAERIKESTRKIRDPKIAILKALPRVMVWNEYLIESEKFISPIINPGISKQLRTNNDPINKPAIIPIIGLAAILMAIKPLAKVKNPLINSNVSSKKLFIVKWYKL